ncbi:MAG: branched-chain amino acid ABC transporter permease [Cyanobacteriota bacterium]|nr:branched-chain amino acid ABC transporter permease [Cyanobacteriota bacterium]
MNDTVRWLYKWFEGEILAIPGRLIAFAFVLFLFLIPLMTEEHYILRVLMFTAIFSIYACSWDLLAGFTGQINLGHGLFFGIAGYISALVNIHLGFPCWITIPIGAFAAVIAGLIVGLPALRLRGFYLSLVTLSFPVIIMGIVLVFPKITGGELGLYGIEGISRSVVHNYYIIQLIMLCSVFVMYKLSDIDGKFIRLGIIFRAIRGDEICARASGINTIKYKLISYALSGFFAGIAGGIYIHFLKTAGPSTLELFFSFQPILWVVFGGTGTIYGGVAGVYILYPLIEMLSLHPIGDQIRHIIFPLMLVFTLLFMPEGITIWVRDKIEVRCQRCKRLNAVTRAFCRVCRAPLRMEENIS